MRAPFATLPLLPPVAPAAVRHRRRWWTLVGKTLTFKQAQKVSFFLTFTRLFFLFVAAGESQCVAHMNIENPALAKQTFGVGAAAGELIESWRCLHVWRAGVRAARPRYWFHFSVKRNKKPERRKMKNQTPLLPAIAARPYRPPDQIMAMCR